MQSGCCTVMRKHMIEDKIQNISAITVTRVPKNYNSLICIYLIPLHAYIHAHTHLNNGTYYISCCSVKTVGRPHIPSVNLYTCESRFARRVNCLLSVATPRLQSPWPFQSITFRQRTTTQVTRSSNFQQFFTFVQ